MLVYDSSSNLIHEASHRRKVDEYDELILNSGETVVSANVVTDYNLPLNMTFLIYTDYRKAIPNRLKPKLPTACERVDHSLTMDHSMSFDVGKGSLHNSIMIK